MADLDISGLETLLNTQKLRELHLGETPKLTLQEALHALSGKPLDAFTHPTMYKMPLEFMYHSRGYEPIEESLTYPVGMHAGFPVSQLIFIQLNAQNTKPEHHLEGDEGLAWSRTAENENPCACDPLEGGGLAVMPFRLDDCLLSLDRLLEQLPGAVAFFAAHGPYELHLLEFQARAGEDMAAKKLALRPDGGLMPIPKRTDAEHRKNLAARCPPTAEPLKPGVWSLLALHEASEDIRNQTWPVSKLRYCFVTLDQDGHLVSFPVREFVESMLAHEIYRADNEDARATLVETFESRMDPGEEGQNTSISPCGQIEAEEAIRLLEIHRERRKEDDKHYEVDRAFQAWNAFERANPGPP